MKYSTILLTVAATLATAQDLSGLPGCALTCGTQNIGLTKCPLSNSECLCGDKPYQDAVQACVQKGEGKGGCSDDDTCKAAQWAAKSCSASVPEGICGAPGGGEASQPPPPSGGTHPPPPPSGGSSPCYGADCGTPSYGSPAESSAAAEPAKPTDACESGSGEGSDGSDGYTTPTEDSSYGSPTETASPADEGAPCPESSGAAAGGYPTGAAAPCPCSTGAGSPVPEGYPAESSAAGVPETTDEAPCSSAAESAPAQETAPAEETAPAAETPCPTSTRAYPPPINTGSPIPAESSAAAVPVYGGDSGNGTAPGGYENSGNKMLTFSSLGAGLVAVAMLVAF